MARYCNVLVFVDEAQVEAEFAGRRIRLHSQTELQRNRFKTPADLWRMIAAIRRFRPDVIHVQEAVGPRRAAFVACIAWIMRRGATVVLTVHDPVPHSGRDEAAAWRTAFVGGYLRVNADMIVVHGAYCAATLRSTFPPPARQIFVSDHGIILEPQAHRPAPGGILKLFMFGRMEAYKGIEVLLNAVETLHAEQFPFELLIAGTGPELDRLQERFALLPEVRVQNEFAQPNVIIDSIQAAECVVLPYLAATQSGVLAAAFGGRRYVIASDTGGLPDVVLHGHNGLLIPPGNAGALAQAIRSLAGDAVLRARLLKGAEATARGQLDWTRIAADAFAVFQQAVTVRQKGNRHLA
jgi:glycosyltransferase involved in cell wall biosynthesis